jgi:hypothetical protein
MSDFLQVHAAGYEPRTIKFTVSSKKLKGHVNPTWLDVNMSPVVRQKAVVSDQVLLLTNPPEEASMQHSTTIQKLVGLTTGHKLSPTPFTDVTPTIMDLVKLPNTLDAESHDRQEQLPSVETAATSGTISTSMKHVFVVLSVNLISVLLYIYLHDCMMCWMLWFLCMICFKTLSRTDLIQLQILQIY